MNTPLNSPAPQPSLVTLKVPDKAALYQSYMPFIKHGGLFIPTTRPYRLGDAVILLLMLLDDPERLSVPGQVVWITPRVAQGKRRQGIGVQFGVENGGVVQKKIETLLVGLLSAENAAASDTF